MTPVVLKMRDSGLSYSQIGAKLHCSRSRAYSLVRKAERDQFFASIPANGLSSRAIAALERVLGVEVEEITPELVSRWVTERRLLSLPNTGLVTMDNISAWLSGYGLRLRDSK